jgi:cell division protein ZapA (FtsZ GTPase activity inhibitor)
MVRVAVMAALNIADDYNRTRGASEQRDEVVDETARNLSAQIAAALESVD